LAAGGGKKSAQGRGKKGYLCSYPRSGDAKTPAKSMPNVGGGRHRKRRGLEGRKEKKKELDDFGTKNHFTGQP